MQRCELFVSDHKLRWCARQMQTPESLQCWSSRRGGRPVQQNCNFPQYKIVFQMAMLANASRTESSEHTVAFDREVQVQDKHEITKQGSCTHLQLCIAREASKAPSCCEVSYAPTSHAPAFTAPRARCRTLGHHHGRGSIHEYDGKGFGTPMLSLTLMHDLNRRRPFL